MEAEEGIRRLCKKKYSQFLDANDQMEGFKDGLSDVRLNLGQIHQQITQVTDRQFY